MRRTLFTILLSALFIVACDGAKTNKPKEDKDILSSDDDSILVTDDDTILTDDPAIDDPGGDDTSTDDAVTDNPSVDTDVTPETCGNGALDGGEVCDGTTDTLANCVDIDSELYKGGKAYCLDTCLGWNTVTCEEVPHTCGNNIKEGPEACDGDTIACVTLDPQKYQGGAATCNDDCTAYLIAGCVEIEPSECGNDIREGIEVCDGGLANCVDIDPLLYSGGKAYCLEDCNGYATDTCTEKPLECESTIDISTKDPYDYAKAIGLCAGVPMAEILLPSGTTGANVNSNALLTALGDVIVPRSGDKLLALSSGQAMNPPASTQFDQKTSSAAPADWYAANGDAYPSSPACGAGTGTTGNTNDGVMAQFELDVPSTVHSFSFDIYFLSVEYSQYICSQFNDFFVALLDSTFTSSVEAQKNPADKNIAVFEGNAVGVNLAPAGLFRQCTNISGSGWAVTSCEGTEELAGTGFEGQGGTGWLTVKGNVVPGETITLRLAIWDLGDHTLDSMVLIDNFKWGAATVSPGMTEAP
ncbi:MAG TPA: choice-of-anchor L domain-containing protein [bacterium]|nr:choice-of-anchor L domain-containing protein [bacterium]